ncbi:MAG: protoheme farnesyltransferase [Nitrososphaeraceae archaeon]|nr:protoheme farnesyltransferase [Nitrososphaeraceae archaeon]
MNLRLYVEVSKPRIVLVLVITAIASALAASRFDASPQVGWDIPARDLILLALSGAVASMGASALNHYFDRDIDGLMERTSRRPIPAHKIAARKVLIYGLCMCVLSIGASWFLLNPYVAAMIFIGIVFYVVVYTIWLKRNNALNIVIGGFAGSAASMAGWASTTGSIDVTGFLVGWLVFMWTPPHFWCLAIKSRDEYASARIPMLPVLIGNEKTAEYIFLNTVILLPYSLALYFFGLGLVYTVTAGVAGSAMLVYHYMLTKKPTPAFAWKAYKVTAPYLVIVFVALALDALFYYRV